MNTMTPIPQNYKNNVNWIIGAYEDAGVTFPNGFQKDAIQNAVGARKTHKWKNWSCDISLITNALGTFIVVEDCGTVGLTGDNIPTTKVNEMMSNGEQLDNTQRLARFSSMFNSGGNTTGGGLFGAGKSVYSVASNTYTYYYDSLREDGKYVANFNKSGQVMKYAYEDEEAKNFILKYTGLSPKQNTGTRIIIESPKQELVEAITSGSIIPYIQESWWLIIEKFDSTSCISVNNVPVSIPEDIKKAKHVYELSTPENWHSGYRVKNFGVYVFEKGKNRWSGISYYRKGMKIGEIELKDVPERVKGNYWGYIEVDGPWEDELAEIEDKVHFGVSKGKKLKTAYQNIKNYCDTKFKTYLTVWGYIKDKELADKKLQEELKQIATDIQNLFDKLGFEDLGKGPNKPDFDVRWQDISFPKYGSETVTSGDNIKFSMRIKSSYTTERNFEYKLFVRNPVSKEKISQIDQGTVKLSPGETIKKDFVHTISKLNSKQYEENRIVLSVKAIGSAKEKSKEISYYYDVEKPDNSRDEVTLYLHECQYPKEGSKRVNFDESLKNIIYRINNKRNMVLSYKLNISLHNVSDGSNAVKMIDVASLVGTVNPYEEEITTPINEITFFKDKIEPFMLSGPVELRARLIATKDDAQYEKGDKITNYHFKLYLNCDEKNGKVDAFDTKSVVDPDNYKRSWYTAAGTYRTIVLNVGHTAYLNVKDFPDIQQEYIKEQMLKQYVMLYLAEGKYEMFGSEFTEMEPPEAADAVIQKVEKIYWNSLK